jgi:chromosome segregation ATPase
MRAFGRTVSGSGFLGAGLALAIVGGATVVVGQGRGEPGDLGSLAALTAEVRELRLAVQQLSQTQAQTQALGVYLSVQQSRVLQVSSQLEAAHKELDTAVGRSSELTSRLASIEEDLTRIREADRRAQIQDAGREMKRELSVATAQEQQARNREQELSQSLQAEESRWSALITRLEALTQR